MSPKSEKQIIKTFVGKVDRELSHLKPDEIRELTENLEDALLERMNDEGESFKLPNPKIFADELLEAAGLASNSAKQSKFNLAALQTWRNFLRYFSTLGPAWAIARGYLMYSVGFGYLAYGGIREIPQNQIDIVVLFITVGLSVWLNIRKFPALKILAVILNVAMLPLTLEFANSLQSKVADYRYFVGTRGVENSIMDSNGNLNIRSCAYDSEGNLLEMETLTSLDGSVIMTTPVEDAGRACQSTRMKG